MTAGQNPLVSVIIPAFNASAHIGRALDSVVAQDYSPIEILVVDDGSTDCTAAIVKNNVPKARLISQENAGVAAARNTGLAQATGDLICFLDADDGWFPGKMRAQVDYLCRHPEVGLVYHDWIVWSPDNVWEEPPKDALVTAGLPEVDQERSGFIYPQLLLSCIIHTSTVMLRRHVVDEVGFFDITLKSGEDYDYWLRVSQEKEIHKLARTYSYYRFVAGSLSTTPGQVNYEYEVVVRALKKWGVPAQPGKYLSSSEVHHHLAVLAFEFGYTQYHRGSTVLAASAFRRAVQHRPFFVRAWIYRAASLIRNML